jgi:dihydroorotate dehydrogenase
MSLIPYALMRPVLFRMDPEAAHDLTLDSMARWQHSPLMKLAAQPRIHDPIHLAGLKFPNRVGLAAGLDKNARCIDAWDALGFGFVEMGTVTPKAQSGNPKPRMFRIPQKQALINRFGFNNEGLEAFVENVKAARCRKPGASPMLLGLNIGKNAATPIEQATQDYVLGLEAVYLHADYITVNISSPNTKNLRALQSDEALDQLLAALASCRADLALRYDDYKPMFLKIAPDLDAEQVRCIARSLEEHDMDGVIATNTTLSREAVAGLRHADEAGGLSGAPVLEASNAVIRQLRAALGPNFPIIGVGGIMSGQDALSKLEAGADVVQLYSGLVYKGPELVTEVAQAIKSSR